MKNLRKIRKAKNITQVELARRLSISQGSVSQMERNGIFNITVAKKYAKVLNCDAILLIEV